MHSIFIFIFVAYSCIIIMQIASRKSLFLLHREKKTQKQNENLLQQHPQKTTVKIIMYEDCMLNITFVVHTQNAIISKQIVENCLEDLIKNKKKKKLRRN